ncbi:aminoglycoside phosphotransferase [Thiorhodococcus drewsii AZ1]|uniref:Aminoglycoside phosphotransferase n=1 Tax=Thiorhodococcus drewsii AZ1 TaxID=765913 RepID=G2DYF0_9GAMM|nr:phosphotransferase [Thiorhodococcus drewsii]EGV32577.1 aminoglycoside phosphotransferase [Thiorhodococcus drewsii AZ1]
MLQQWLADVLATDSFELTPASSDASFRRYWRLAREGTTLIAMDAPPAHEDCGRFADLSRRFRQIGVNTPEIHAENREQGFLLLSDLGNRVYLGELDDDTAGRLYADALSTLATIQARAPVEGLPVYDAPFFQREMDLFGEWLLGRHLGIVLDAGEQTMFDRAHASLIDSALDQPRVCVHRDFHSRNLMLTETANPGVLDFQDAVLGPLTYDLASLLRDCYIAWPEERVRDWALGYLDLAIRSEILEPVPAERFLRWFDLMGMQRHLKACGIFARLNHRDGKPHYLADVPRTLGYVIEVAGRYPEFGDLADFLRRCVMPGLSSVSP